MMFKNKYGLGDPSPREQVNNETGAVDLSSVMIGTIVIALIVGVISATIFTVIPWAQDQAAKEQVKELSEAQVAYSAASKANEGDSTTIEGSGDLNNPYANLTSLRTSGLITTEISDEDPNLSDNKSFCASVPVEGEYLVMVRSGSGNVFYANSESSGKPEQADRSTVNCLGNSGTLPSAPPAVTDTPGVLSMRVNMNNPGCYAMNIHAEVPAGSETTMSINGGTPTPITGSSHEVADLMGVQTIRFEGKVNSLSNKEIQPDSPRQEELITWYNENENTPGVESDPRYREMAYHYYTQEINTRPEFRTMLFTNCIVEVEEWDDNLGLTDLSYFAAAGDSYSHDSEAHTNAMRLPDTLPVTVRDTSYMFHNTSYFNDDLSNWDMSNVENVTSMFHSAERFQSDLSGWTLNSATDLTNMFNSARAFNSDLSQWNVSNVKNMTGLFAGASSFNSDLSQWNVSNVENMSGLFSNASSFNSDLSQWNVSNVENMTGLFAGASNFNSNLSNWNVSNITNMTNMFSGASSFNANNISTWDVSNVKNMTNLFSNNPNLQGDLSEWDTSNVKQMNSLFYGSTIRLTGLEEWDTSNVENMASIFQYAATPSIDISTWDTRKVTDLSSAFKGASAFNGDVSEWETPKLTNLRETFADNTTFNDNIGTWDTSKVTQMNNLFRGTQAFNADISQWNTSNVINMAGMFSKSRFNGDISEWDVKKVTDMSSMFLDSQFNNNIGEWEPVKLVHASQMFQNSQFNNNIGEWDVRTLRSMTNMFNGATLFNQDLSGWAVSSAASKAGISQGAIAWLAHHKFPGA